MTAAVFGFLGAGRMATALAQGLIRGGMVPPEHLLASDPVSAAREAFSAATGAEVLDNNLRLVERAQVVVLAVKPQQWEAAVGPLRAVLTPGHLVVSIMAGVTLARLRAALGPDPRLVRVMPNTPALVGEGASGFTLADNCTAEDAPFVERMLGCVGIAQQVSEPALDAVTGLSGSGPAFVYLMIEALSDAGVLCGLPRDVATRLAAQTLRGGASMVLETGQHPGVLKDQVTSPAGTTIAGLTALESGAVRASLIEAVRRAFERSRELGG